MISAFAHSASLAVDYCFRLLCIYCVIHFFYSGGKRLSLGIVYFRYVLLASSARAGARVSTDHHHWDLGWLGESVLCICPCTSVCVFSDDYTASCAVFVLSLV